MSLLPNHIIYGIDFSGARDAGKKIWIAKGILKDGNLSIEDCIRAEDLEGSGTKLEKCLSALRNLIGKSRYCVFGMDFPFGLPEALVTEKSWKEFVIKFPEKYKNPEEFRENCRSMAPGKELKRKTDIQSRTPFSVYNLRLYKQTYCGISEIINPLVRKDLARVLPMQKPKPGKPLLLEVCPASTLKALDLYNPYKGRDIGKKAERRKILKEYEKLGTIKIDKPEISRSIIDNPGGDALDSVIAAGSAFWALKNNMPLLMEEYKIEGYVYE